VDDGSTDASASILADRIAGGLDARLVRFSRNFGHQSAVCAGLDHAEGDLVVVMDADLQDPPEVVLPMVDQWRRGADVVFARRRRRKGNALKRLGYWGFYRLVGFLSDIRLPLDTGDFGLMDRRVVLALRSLPERLRFPRGLRAWVGFRQEAIEFDRPERRAGTPKYAWRHLYRLATDGIASMSTRPLQVAQVCSFLFGLLTIGLLVLLLAGYATSASAIPKPFLLAYVLVASGNAVQSLCLYILGAYVGRTYLEVKGRPPYLVMEVVEQPR
jgi:glycosyltransferase involved in cell wall biosynthesis